MKREIITIGEGGKVHIPTSPVWMSACEIADLFGVFSGKVSNHIKSIFKEGLLREDEVTYVHNRSANFEWIKIRRKSPKY